MTNKNVILVGCGNMGYAMLQGWLASETLQPADVTVIEPAAALRERASHLGVTALANSEALADTATPRLIILAVKPQMVNDILPDYSGFAFTATFVSVIAGTPIAQFENALSPLSAIIRCMPNTPAAIGKGMIATFANGNVAEEDFDFTEQLLKSSGKIVRLTEESQLDAVTAVSGSGPAYVFYFIECLTKAGIEAGLSEDVAAILAKQTVYGAGILADTSSETPSQLRVNVTSPNGTTAAALDVLMKDDSLQNLISKAVDAARQRSVELGKN